MNAKYVWRPARMSCCACLTSAESSPIARRSRRTSRIGGRAYGVEAWAPVLVSRRLPSAQGNVIQLVVEERHLLACGEREPILLVDGDLCITSAHRALLRVENADDGLQAG